MGVCEGGDGHVLVRALNSEFMEMQTYEGLDNAGRIV